MKYQSDFLKYQSAVTKTGSAISKVKSALKRATKLPYAYVEVTRGHFGMDVKNDVGDIT